MGRAQQPQDVLALCQHCRLGSFMQWSCWMSVVFKHETHHLLQFLKLPSLHYSHFTDEETQVSRGNLICLKSHSENVTEIEAQSELRLKSRSICLQSHCHTVSHCDPLQGEVPQGPSRPFRASVMGSEPGIITLTIRNMGYAWSLNMKVGSSSESSPLEIQADETKLELQFSL